MKSLSVAILIFLSTVKANPSPQIPFIDDILGGIGNAGGGFFTSLLKPGSFFFRLLPRLLENPSFRNAPLPSSFVPPEYQKTRDSLCKNGAKVSECKCEPGRPLTTMGHQEGNPSIAHIMRLFNDCMPTECECSDGEVVTMSVLGCEDGGVPRCRDDNNNPLNDGLLGLMDKMLCRNGKEIDPETMMAFKDKKECICPDKKLPVCAATGERPTCYDGSKPNHAIAKLPPPLQTCIDPDA